MECESAGERDERSRDEERSLESCRPWEPRRNVSLDEVRREERENALRRRREAAKLAPPREASPGQPGDVVGLALSGGGLRSACFGLGIVQAFYQKGLWRHVDYLSTVSGGGYIGSFLASYVVRKNEPLRKDNCPILPRPEDEGKQPPDVQRFIYGGRFLMKPWELFNKYLIGLYFINLALFSLAVAVRAAVAFLWRCLDYDAVRDRARLFGLHGDVQPVLWPLLFFTACWLAAWVVSYWRRGAEAPGNSFTRSDILRTWIPLKTTRPKYTPSCDCVTNCKTRWRRS